MTASTRLESLVRAELQHRSGANSNPARPSHARRQQEQEGGQPRRPAVTAAGAPGLADTGTDERAAASMTLAAAPRARRKETRRH
jgi:hypothetical protein